MTNAEYEPAGTNLISDTPCTEESKMLDFDDIKKGSFWRAVLAELFGTTFFIFLLTGILSGQNASSMRLTGIAFGIGLSIAVLVQTFGPVSGAHLNPAVTIGILAKGDIGVMRAIFYTIAQFIGGIIGAAITYGLTPSNTRNGLGAQTLQQGITNAQGFFMEMLLTMLLVLTVLASTSSDNNRKNFGFANALAIGLSITVAHFVGVSYTGAGINPARTFGPAVVVNQFGDDHWVYWAGPYVGGILSGLLYRFIFSVEQTAKETYNTSNGRNVEVGMTTH